MNDSERDSLLTKATSAHQAGNLQQAESDYRQLWSQKQDDNLGYLLGTLLLQKGDAEQAIDFLSPIAARNLQSADLQNNLGIAFQMTKNYEQALNSFQAALRADKNYPPVYHNLGKFFVEVDNFVEAEKCYRQATVLQPDDLQCREEWVNVLIQLGMWEDSLRELNVLLQHDPDNTATRTSIIFVLAKLNQYEEAISHCQKVLLIKPNAIEIHSNLSYLHEHAGNIEEAIASAKKAFELAPQSAEVANNLGIAYRSAHRTEEAISTFKIAIELSAELSLAKFNLGSTQLLDEQYPAGWENYESRRELMAHHSDLEAIPKWNGEQIPGKKLLVSCDQGFGDAIQFSRFLPRIKQESQAEIILQTAPELIELFEGSSYQKGQLVDSVISETDAMAEVDYHFSLASAGALFQLTIEQVQMDQSYLQAPETPANEVKNRVESPIKTIGLCWRGNAKQAQDHVRTMELLQLKKLSEVEGIRWVSLQIDATPEELASWSGEIENAGTSLQSFAETAAVIEQVDLLITVDTAIAHLAGAMNQPVWTLLANTPDWRWHLGRTDSPWYPSMKLFRQPSWGNWDAVIEQVVLELKSNR